MGIDCFDPAPLPPQPPLNLAQPLQLLLSQTDRALARLDGAASTVPNPELFVYAFLRQEATLSSQIEGTEASLDDLFKFEADDEVRDEADVVDIANYLDAIEWARAQLGVIPLSVRLLKGAHKRLLSSGRGANRRPGELRDGQNHIGPPGCTISEASFVPPAVPIMQRALSELEAYLHTADEPPLIRAAYAHAQFETIHPFWDGNGRLGRMLTTLMLINEEILERPLLYLSLFFKLYKTEYYARLQAVRDDGDWEGWVAFFLRGVRVTSRSALDTARAINQLRDEVMAESSAIGKSANYVRLAEALFRRPFVSATDAANILGATHQTGTNVITKLLDAGILSAPQQQRRKHIFVFRRYLDVLDVEQIDLRHYE